MDMCKPTEADLAQYPHCFLTSDATWDQTFVDEEFALTTNVGPLIATLHDHHDHCVDTFGDCITNGIIVAPHDLQCILPDLELLHPHFGWVSKECIQSTLDNTSQHCCAMKCNPFHKHFESRFPAVNVH